MSLSSTSTLRPPSGEGAAPCPVRGCLRDLPIAPDEAHLPLHCTCPQRKPLQIGLSGTGAWVLRERSYGQAERALHNAIAHALVTERIPDSERTFRSRRPVTAPDRTTAQMTEAYLAMNRAARDMAQRLRTGDYASASNAAERFFACDHAYLLLSKRYNRAREKSGLEKGTPGLWHHSPTFAVKDGAGHEYILEFEAMFNDAGTDITVANDAEIEQRSGLPVGLEGWRQLVRLLQRVETGKPGRAPDLHHLIWRISSGPDRGELKLRDHVKSHYKQAVVALEALRLTLRPQHADATLLPVSFGGLRPARRERHGTQQAPECLSGRHLSNRWSSTVPTTFRSSCACGHNRLISS